ncbi:carbohydrate-binding module family 13 protein [Macrolepiota fuliginosa MF-IS2]|uniref:Carbohydrate-binding module family 13 protein n=1 Tax=Macrolepiota fuliginosa MF-IS2 TaxID=1400762 RepID=A0A9P5XFS0_9AGAR|nr:carbohydrate-binding module family 13 protein [Macrolepiota fuliginosa MF-IS2]
MPTQELQSGHRYKVTNLKNKDACLDLSGADNRSIIGYGWHGGDNQKWEAKSESGGWTLKNVASGSFISVEGGQGNSQDGSKIIAEKSPTVWNMEKDENGSMRMSYKASDGSDKSVDLIRHGEGPDVTIWDSWKPGSNQCWQFDEA